MATDRDLAFLLMNDGQFVQAIAHFSELIEQGDNDPLLHYHRAECYFSEGEIDLCVEDLNHLLRLLPKCALVAYSAGKLFIQIDQLEDALRSFETAAALLSSHHLCACSFASCIEPPDLSSIYREQGQCSQELGRHQDALRQFCLAIESDKKDSLSYALRGHSHGQLGIADGAMADFDKAIKLAPESIYGYWFRAQFSSENGQVELALSDLNKVTDLDSENFEAYLIKSTLSAADNKPHTAMTQINEALRIDPESANGHWVRGYLHFQAGRDEEAVEDFNASASYEAPDADLHAYRGRSYVNLGNYSGAIYDLTEALKMDSDQDHGLLYASRATAYMQGGYFEEAIADLTKALELNYDAADCFYDRACCYHELGDAPKAVEDFSRRLARKPKCARSLYGRGQAYCLAEDWAAAIADYSKALQLDSGMLEAWNGRAIARRASGDLQGALADIDDCLELEPDNDFLQGHRASLLAEISSNVTAIGRQAKAKSRSSSKENQSAASTPIVSTPEPEEPLTPLQTAYCRHVFASFDQQSRLVALVEEELGPDWRWDCSQSEGHLILSAVSPAKNALQTVRDKRMVFDLQYLGSHSRKDNTWMWAWNNDYLDQTCVTDAARLRKIGKELGITEITSKKKTLQLNATSLTAEQLSIAGAGLLGADAVFYANVGDAVFHMLINCPALRSISESVAQRIGNVHRTVIGSQPLPDHWLALKSYLAFYGLTYSEQENELHWRGESDEFIKVNRTDESVTLEYACWSEAPSGR